MRMRISLVISCPSSTLRFKATAHWLYAERLILTFPRQRGGQKDSFINTLHMVFLERAGNKASLSRIS